MAHSAPTESNDAFPFDQSIAWQPDPDVVATSNLRRFMDWHGIDDYDALMTRSTDDIAWFWNAVLDDLDIAFYEDYDQIVDLSDGIQFPTWCVGGRMNIVHNLLDKWQGTEVEDRTALRWEGEDGTTVRRSHASRVR